MFHAYLSTRFAPGLCLNAMSLSDSSSARGGHWVSLWRGAPTLSYQLAKNAFGSRDFMCGGRHTDTAVRLSVCMRAAAEANDIDVARRGFWLVDRWSKSSASTRPNARCSFRLSRCSKVIPPSALWRAQGHFSYSSPAMNALTSHPPHAHASPVGALCNRPCERAAHAIAC